jgi:hypothetical protein
METKSQQEGGARRLQASEVAEFVRDVLFAADRDRPVVALTTDVRRGCSLVDADRIAGELRGMTDVVEIETGDATWALSDAMPPRLDVYGGAARIWWPGLTAQSDPYAHRLYFIYSDADAKRVEEQLLSAVRRDAEDDAGFGEPGASTDQPEPGTVLSATVTALESGRIAVVSGELHGAIVEADLPISVLTTCLTVGSKLDVQLVRRQGDGACSFSLAGMVPNSWEILGREVRVGEVLVGRVQNIAKDKGLIFVDVLPGAVGICHISELHFEYVRDIDEYAEPGELLPFEVLALDSKAMKIELSRKGAFGQAARPSPSLVPGGRPFAWAKGMPMFESLRRAAQRGPGDRSRVRVLGGAASAPSAAPHLEEQVQALSAELSAALDQRMNLVEEIRSLRQQVTQLKKELRSATDRHEAHLRKATGDLDPLSSERAFLLAIRVCHARMFEEHDRQAHPLRRMRVGPEFLRTLRELEGVTVDKVVEVCTQVACGMASAIPAREVHQLREGPRGAGGRTREADNAKAWRCSLQDNTASARRLHWWSVPGEDG